MNSIFKKFIRDLNLESSLLEAVDTAYDAIYDEPHPFIDDVHETSDRNVKFGNGPIIPLSHLENPILSPIVSKLQKESSNNPNSPVFMINYVEFDIEYLIKLFDKALLTILDENMLKEYRNVAKYLRSIDSSDDYGNKLNIIVSVE